MRRRTSSTVVAALLCAALAACGGARQGAAAGEGTDAATIGAETREADGTEAKTAGEQPDPKEQFVGDWYMAAMSGDDYVFTGDLTSYAQDDTGLPNFAIRADGTCTTRALGTPAETAAHYTWELVADDVIELTYAGELAEGEEPTVLVGTYDAGAIEIVPKDAELEDETTTVMLVTRDGTTDRYVSYDVSKAEPLTDAADLVGTWGYAAFVYGGGMTMYGDAIEELAAGINEGEGVGLTATFREDGTATIMGSEATWEVTDDGITYTMEVEHNYHVSTTGKLLAEHGALLVDMSGVMAMDGGAYFAMTR